MNNDRNTNINDGNYNESIQGDYIETKITLNNSTNIFIQKADQLFIGGEENFNIKCSNDPQFSLNIDQHCNIHKFTKHSEFKQKYQSRYQASQKLLLSKPVKLLPNTNVTKAKVSRLTELVRKLNNTKSYTNPNQSGIKELLTQLENVIADYTDLDNEDKEAAAENLKAITQAILDTHTKVIEPEVSRLTESVEKLNKEKYYIFDHNHNKGTLIIGRNIK